MKKTAIKRQPGNCTGKSAVRQSLDRDRGETGTLEVRDNFQSKLWDQKHQEHQSWTKKTRSASWGRNGAIVFGAEERAEVSGPKRGLPATQTDWRLCTAEQPTVVGSRQNKRLVSSYPNERRRKDRREGGRGIEELKERNLIPVAPAMRLESAERKRRRSPTKREGRHDNWPWRLRSETRRRRGNTHAPSPR